MDGPKNLAHYLSIFGGMPRPLPIQGVRQVSQEREAIGAYFGSMGSDWIRLVEKFANQLPPMRKAVRVAALIPAWQEQARIGKALDAILAENARIRELSTAILEVCILQNWVSGESPDNMGATVAHWIERRRPPFKVLFMKQQWGVAQSRQSLALSRKLLADIILLRSLRRRAQSGALYLLSEDADTECVDSGRTQAAVDVLDFCPSLDGVRGIQERSRGALALNQLLLLERRSWHFTELQFSCQRLSPQRWENANFYWNRVVTAGSNCCFTAEIYARIGGYDPTISLFEDMDIGQKISVLRGAWQGRRFCPNTTTVRRFPYREESSAARAILALAESHHIYCEDESAAPLYNRTRELRLRTSGIDSLLALIRTHATIASSNVARFETELSKLRVETFRILGDPLRADFVFRRTMAALGFSHSDWIDRPCEGISLRNFLEFRRRSALFSERVLVKELTQSNT